MSSNFSAERPRELIVEDLPLVDTRGGARTEGVDWPECIDQFESCRTIVGPRDPNGAFVSARVEWVGDGSVEARGLRSVSNLIVVEVDFLLGDMDFRPSDDSRGIREVLVRAEAGVTIFSGNGNRGPLSFFRLLSLKNVVVVEIV